VEKEEGEAECSRMKRPSTPASAKRRSSTTYASCVAGGMSRNRSPAAPPRTCSPERDKDLIDQRSK
jgi:hypothetical protein